MKRLVVAALCGVLVSWIGVGTAQGAGKMRHTLPAGCTFAKGYVTCTETTTTTQTGPRNGEVCTTTSMQAGRISRSQRPRPRALGCTRARRCVTHPFVTQPPRKRWMALPRA